MRVVVAMQIWTYVGDYFGGLVLLNESHDAEDVEYFRDEIFEIEFLLLMQEGFYSFFDGAFAGRVFRVDHAKEDIGKEQSSEGLAADGGGFAIEYELIMYLQGVRLCSFELDESMGDSLEACVDCVFVGETKKQSQCFEVAHDIQSLPGVLEYLGALAEEPADLEHGVLLLLHEAEESLQKSPQLLPCGNRVSFVHQLYQVNAGMICYAGVICISHIYYVVLFELLQRARQHAVVVARHRNQLMLSREVLQDVQMGVQVRHSGSRYEEAENRQNLVCIQHVLLQLDLVRFVESPDLLCDPLGTRHYCLHLAHRSAGLGDFIQGQDTFAVRLLHFRPLLRGSRGDTRVDSVVLQRLLIQAVLLLHREGLWGGASQFVEDACESVFFLTMVGHNGIEDNAMKHSVLQYYRGNCGQDVLWVGYQLIRFVEEVEMVVLHGAFFKKDQELLDCVCQFVDSL